MTLGEIETILRERGLVLTLAATPSGGWQASVRGASDGWTVGHGDTIEAAVRDVLGLSVLPNVFD